MEDERREEQETRIQAYVRLPSKEVHQSRSEGSGYEAAEVADEAGSSGATKASVT
jgi:hypothetical protein